MENTRKEHPSYYYLIASMLLSLKNKSITSVAKSCGLNHSNVAGWLKGREFMLSIEKQNIFLERLGYSGNTLASDRVHRWIIFDDLSVFQRFLGFISETTIVVPEIVRLGPIAPAPIHLLKHPFSESLYAITGSFRALVRRSIPSASPNTSIWDIEDVFRDNLTGRPILDWRKTIQKDGEFDNEPTIRIENSIFDKWWRFPDSGDEDISLEEFDQVWNSVKTLEGREKERDKKLSWKDFISWAEQKGISPEEVFRKINGE